MCSFLEAPNFTLISLPSGCTLSSNYDLCKAFSSSSLTESSKTLTRRRLFPYTTVVAKSPNGYISPQAFTSKSLKICGDALPELSLLSSSSNNSQHPFNQKVNQILKTYIQLFDVLSFDVFNLLAVKFISNFLFLFSSLFLASFFFLPFCKACNLQLDQSCSWKKSWILLDREKAFLTVTIYRSSLAL